MTVNPLENITKIGNYALPVFGAFLTATFSVSKLDWEGERERYLLIALALYTILSAFVSYCHRIAWLRQRKKQELNDERPGNLSTCTVIFFMAIHFAFIISLSVVIYNFVWK